MKRYSFLRKIYAEDVEIWPYRKIYSDSRTGKIYLEEKVYRLSSRPLTPYEMLVNQFLHYRVYKTQSNTSFVYQYALKCQLPLNDFAKQNGFAVRSKPEIPNEGENDGK